MRASWTTGGLVLAAILWLVPSPVASQPAGPSRPATVRGRVVDAESGLPVDQAEVVLVGTDRRANTDEQGRFVLEGVVPGTWTLSVLRLGYAPLRRELVVAEGAEQALELRLRRTAIPLQEVTVTPGSFSFMGEGVGLRQTMSREDVAAVPQVGDDIFRAVNRLPGLASNDYAAHFGIRGGRHDETLILLDGLELFEPYHLKDFNEGAISIVDAEIIDGVELMTGGFPARYGNRRSGVFDIRSRTPEAGRTHVSIGASMFNTHAMAMGGFGQGKGSWLAFGRTGYMDLVFQLIDQADLPKPQYEDAFARLSYRLHPSHELALEALHAGDRYHYDIPATTGFSDTIVTQEVADTRYGNSYAWTTLRSALGPRTNVRTMLAAGLVTRDRRGFEQAVQLTEPYYRIASDRRYTTLGAAQDWTLGVSENDIVSFGADFRRLRVTDTYDSRVNQDPNDPEPPAPGEYPILTGSRLERSGSRFALYLSNRWRALRPLVFETGVRYDRATWTGDRDLSPRASAALDLGRGMTLRLGWGVYRQMQNLDEVSALDSDTRYFRSERSEQWTAGWERVWSRGSRLRVEGYLKFGTRLRPVFRNWRGAVDAFPEPNEDRIRVIADENTSRGLEVYYDRPLGRSLTARASYSFAVADEDVVRIENVNSSDPLTFDLAHPGPQDQRHAANADLTWRLGRYTLNGSFAYHSGWPTTHEHLVPVVNELGQPDFAVRPLELYGERLPDYMRLDFRATRRWPTRLGRFEASLEVINATNHANVFGYDYFKRKDGSGQIVLDRGDETWFTILPSLGVTWTRNF